MPTKYIPRPDADFAAFASNYYQAVEKWWSIQGLDDTDLKPLKNALDAWAIAYPKHIAAQNAAEAARQTKDAARLALEAQVRPIANFIQTFPKTTDADRATIGITVRQPGSIAPRTPTSRPLVQVEHAGRLQHTIRFVDESGPGAGRGGATRKARPKGVLGAEVRLKLVSPGTTPPTDPLALSYLTLATNGAAQATFPAEDGGKLAVYMLRWVGPRGATGPWSEAAVATVAA